MADCGERFKRCIHRLRDRAMLVDALAERVELLLRRKLPVQEKVCDFAEDRMRGKVADVIAAIVQARPRAADSANGGRARDDAGEDDGLLAFSHSSSPARTA